MITNYQPADLCSDEEFIRRVTLDVVGLLPTIEETRAFLDDRTPDKRARLIDSLLSRPEYALFWGQKTADLLRIQAKKLSDKGARVYGDWVVDAVAANMPWDPVRHPEAADGDGDSYQNAAANYFRAAEDDATVTETTAQLFLGIRLACARCHNHPFERWTQDNYYGLAAVFHRVQRTGKRDGAAGHQRGRAGEVTQPRTGRQMAPWLPLEGEARVGPDEDRRVVFARWLTRPDNPFFARNEVNRLWAQVMGQGIVEPVDDFRESNPPANAVLLDALAEDFVKNGFDRKHTLRVILNSRTYQQKAERNRFNASDERHFSSCRVRLLSAEQVFDAVTRVTGVGDDKPTSFATQRPLPQHSGFLTAFGQPARTTACQCERLGEPTLEQALQLLNGPTVQSARCRRAATASASCSMRAGRMPR